MWLTNSSIGRKFVMSLTGLCLVLFLTFHACMNIVVVIDDVLGTAGYNWICSMLGANWYAVAATMGLGLLMMIHFVYAFVLTIQNRKARGNDRYAMTTDWKEVDWNSKNMLALGLIICGFLVLHLYNFWFKMMFQELSGLHTGMFDPVNGSAYVKYLFTGIVDPNEVICTNSYLIMPEWSHIVYCVLYLVWIAAIFFHLEHGIWSAFHTIGWTNNVWLNRVKVIGLVWAALVCLMFAAVVVYYMGVSVGVYLHA